MRWFNFCILCLCFSAFTSPKASISFISSSKDFGHIKHKDKQTAIFHYTNSGEVPLVIVDAKANCGCTKVKYSSRPLAAGQRDSIVVVYDAKSSGAFYKKIEIISNSQESVELIIKGIVD